MRRALSLRFDRTLAGSERAALESLLLSLAVAPTSWVLAASLARTYARCEVAGDAEDAVARLGAARPARVDLPPLVVLQIVPEGAAALAALAEALGGEGRPRGIVSCERAAPALVVELDAETTSLDLVVALIDAELRGRPRRIVPLLPLEDDVLARFAAARLGAAAFGASRIIETHSEALLRG